MNVLLVGSGAREHSIAWRLVQSPRLTKLWVADGNAGTASIATNLAIKPEDVDGIIAAANSLSIDLVVVGPELPLSLGIVDRLSSQGIAAFGPTKAAARIETSKSFALELMKEAAVPCPDFWVFQEEGAALEFLKNHSGPTVVKADGLAAGKGVMICENANEAAGAISACMNYRAFGKAGDTVVIEELLTGPEVSVFAFCDGEHISSLVAACDYKRLEDGNFGPNTGGMGSYSPPGFWDQQLAHQVEDAIMRPVVDALSRRGHPYKGVLYAGLMLTAEGPKVLEFNCRLGDPETQVVLPRLATDPLDLFQACVEGRLDQVPVKWKDQCHVGVVLASGGYPGKYETGFTISGADSGADDAGDGSILFHAATRHETKDGLDQLVTSGGRVMTVVGQGRTLAEARAKAYHRARRISFDGVIFRKDIAELAEQRSVASSPMNPG
ncbi:MAG: phosphoribosylamine--glycine ligase [SAR202 cluster bacterium Io17-Chloro-G7]|nr:MAG: phosphoribosylamine--glycine ligase [SAR202 cluster bacterium Io17-Chloro-G7]